MVARKIDAMHHLYGIGEGTCTDCPFLREGIYHDKKLIKCSVYGMTHSEATDWRKKYTACGLKHSARPDDTPVIDRLRGQRAHVSVQCEWQIKMEVCFSLLLNTTYSSIINTNNNKGLI